jgi:methylmalonyl-CoA/ethylmalonyl-CoA epimerase
MNFLDFGKPFLQIHHIGFAVRNHFQALEQLRMTVPGLTTEVDAIRDPAQQATISLLRQDRGSALLYELVSPADDADEDAPIQKIVRRQRGAYHICFTADKFDELLELWTRRSSPVFGPVPAVAFGGRRVVFFLFSEIGLFEILEAEGAPGSST